MQPGAKVVFTPAGRRGTFTPGTPVLDAARELGVDIASICGGRGLCGRCQILCSEGDFPKHGIVSRNDHLSPFTATERDYGTRRKPLEPGRRLSCQATVQGDLVIDVPPESQVHRQVVRKEADRRTIELDPVVRLYFVAVEEPVLHDARSDLTRLREALKEQWALTGLSCGIRVTAGLQPALRDGDWSVTVAVHRDREIIALWPGYTDETWGLAIDVGSTTIAAHLCDLSSGEVVSSNGMMNPQIRFGEDLMSRVSYVMMHPQGSREMTGAVRGAINELIERTSTEAGIAAEDILSIVFVCNPVMHHLLLGLSPVELGGAPFALAVDTSVYVPARELDIAVNPGGVAYVLPCIAGHVGADTAGVILSEQPHERDGINLVVDIGTNAEIVLGNRHRLLACSSPTGPAFEGAQISCGQRAAPGAIERVRIDPQTLETRIRVIGSDLWSDDPGFAGSVPGGIVTGICGSGIIEAVVEMMLAGVLSGDGVIDGALPGRGEAVVPDGRTFSFVLHRGDPVISVTQNDVRQIQLAKAALYAGVKLLMDRLEVDCVDSIRLAGAFGSHIDVKYAMALGIVPDCPLEKAGPAGNAAGTGARIALLNNASREEIETVVRRIERVETAVEPKFQDYFVDAMAIPHNSDPFPNLESAFPLPSRGRASHGMHATAVAPRRRRRRQGKRA